MYKTFNVRPIADYNILFLNTIYRSIINVKKITIAFFSPVITGLVASLFLYLPNIFPFRLPPEWVKFVSTVPTIATMATGGIVFYSSQRERRRTELTEHYKRISENVFKSWSNAVPDLALTARDLPTSFMPLYTNIVSIIKSPGRYHEAKSHLGSSYWNVNKVLNDLERLEENHNQQVASLITTLDKEIIDTIHNRNKHRHCNIDVSIHQYNVLTAADQPWYNINCIYGHFRDEANHNHGKLTVVPFEENTAALRREKPTEIPIDLGLGTEEDMNCLMQIVLSFQASIVYQLRMLKTNGDEINEMFNKTLQQELTPIIQYIDDGYLGGKCNFEYGYPPG